MISNIQPDNRLSTRFRARAAVWYAVVVAFVLGSVAPAVACVGCRVNGEGVQQTEQSTVTAGIAFSWSVLFMLFVVSVLLTFMVSYITRMVSELDRRNGAPPQ